MATGKKKRIEIRESEIPNLEIKVSSNNFQPVGVYTLPNFWKNIGGFNIGIC